MCPIHLVLARAGGGYEPKWICDKCDEENAQKNADRGTQRYGQRVGALLKVKGMGL